MAKKKKKWSLLINEEKSYGEIIPDNDDKEHLFGGLCHCTPIVEITPKGGVLITHRSYDGREIIEWVMEIINGKSEENS